MPMSPLLGFMIGVPLRFEGYLRLSPSSRSFCDLRLDIN